ncbi:Uncharacterised protein [Vibrio cholerae]|nr:Uncharacterised protein [Vibrio cholerae]
MMRQLGVRPLRKRWFNATKRKVIRQNISSLRAVSPAFTI